MEWMTGMTGMIVNQGAKAKVPVIHHIIYGLVVDAITKTSDKKGAAQEHSKRKKRESSLVCEIVVITCSVLVERFQLDFGSQFVVLIRRQCMSVVGHLVNRRRYLYNLYWSRISLHMLDCFQLHL
jgi:hypothetical protein